jgi:C4-type Zn-finger protein
MKLIKVDRCSRCPYRFADVFVADESRDICVRRQRRLDQRACMKKGEFPKGCPLPDAKEEK